MQLLFLYSLRFDTLNQDRCKYSVLTRIDFLNITVHRHVALPNFSNYDGINEQFRMIEVILCLAQLLLIFRSSGHSFESVDSTRFSFKQWLSSIPFHKKPSNPYSEGGQRAEWSMYRLGEIFWGSVTVNSRYNITSSINFVMVLVWRNYWLHILSNKISFNWSLRNYAAIAYSSNLVRKYEVVISQAYWSLYHHDLRYFVHSSEWLGLNLT